ncbi:ABC transporter permease [Demequina capsici]|uniref:ABC transporter permease subunit n=1 Tax=Demequina capsici TaxID=3075620 RepID=A0AA96F8K9_9MICO|nr:ABC transporter permease subunit [Demequina sp. OYTSA14]WNM25569.1 ABC transporter permease subunit [Demequina sp. OYTSA14]
MTVSPIVTGPASHVRPPGRHAPTLRTQAALVRWGTIAVAVLVWEVVTRTVLADDPYLAPPSAVLTTGLCQVLQPDALGELWNTTARFLVSFAVVAALGIPLGIVLGRISRAFYEGSRDVVTILYATPLVPFYPLLVLWVGLGAPSEIAFGVLHGIVPVVLIVMTASHGVRSDLLEAAHTMGASRMERLAAVVVPASLGEIVGALKIGASLTMLGVLLAELMISIDGVGSFIARQIVNHQAERLDAMILVVCVGVVAVNSLLSAVARRVSHDGGR